MSTKVMTNPLKELQKFGQSVWLDYIRRSLITSGELQKMIDEDGLRGMTSNPAIFEKAIGGSTDYADVLKQSRESGLTDAMQVYEKIAIRDIQDAADILHAVYKQTNGRDGFISLEVSPFLANDTEGTLKEARRLWKTVARENVMIKVPGTDAGIPAIKQLISEGININVTLLFSQDTYVRVTKAYIEGLEALSKKGEDISKIASVASFFISRIDSLVDNLLNEKIKTATNDPDRKLCEGLLGKVAIANGKETYKKYQEIFSSAQWNALAAKGAKTQRVLWASTSTKNPKYPDTLYVDDLIGPDTVNTIPPSTFDAFRDHGHVKQTLTENVGDAVKVMTDLEKTGISMKKVTDDLVVEGVKLFADAFQKLLDTVQKQIGEEKQPAIDRFSYKLPQALDSAVKATIKQWQEGDKLKRLWSKDSTLWTSKDENKWLDWLGVTEDMQAHLGELKKVAKEVADAGFTHAIVLGMGGSSLCPDVLAHTFGTQSGAPKLHVLDSTDPAQVLQREKELDLAKTIFIVSSKSGSTLEPNIFKQYFWEKVSEKVGKEKTAERFIAITDPGSHMQKLAESEKFRHIFYGVPGIGGRYSALSNFGMVPAAMMGLDAGKLLDAAEEMVHACAASVPVDKNPGAVLGAIMGTLAVAGRDKLTLITSPAIYDLGAWLEQLLAESTGKQGKGIIPVDREPLAQPQVYGGDRLFVYLRLETAANAEQDKAVEALERAGHPVVRINIPDAYQLPQEFFRWEIATAVAGAIIGINAFDQPDVEASKIATRKLTEEYEKTGSLPKETPFFESSSIKLYSDEKNVKALNDAVGTDKSLVAYLRAHLNRIKDGDYFATIAYIEMNDQHESTLQKSRVKVRDNKHVATCLGFGPRFLHSTGQAYKGGPNKGVFLQITCDDAKDVPVPQQKYTFGLVKAAQARGDFQVLAERDRRALRVHLGKDTAAGLSELGAAIEQAFAK
ncbi:MAG TPA: bifunctional transaldolase/phosoglucose isomerase [Planktothrix sp.]|jgi:transaldolase/glucose-6-phosphate isomerase